MDFLYATDTEQYFYSENRQAVGYYWRMYSTDKWYFDGWLWDGKLTTRGDAVRELDEYVGAYK